MILEQLPLINILQCEKDPDKRFALANEVVTALQKLHNEGHYLDGAFIDIWIYDAKANSFSVKADKKLPLHDNIEEFKNKDLVALYFGEINYEKKSQNINYDNKAKGLVHFIRAKDKESLLYYTKIYQTCINFIQTQPRLIVFFKESFQLSVNPNDTFVDGYLEKENLYKVTPLTVAVAHLAKEATAFDPNKFNNNQLIIESLLDLGADPAAKNYHGFSAISIAEKYSNLGANQEHMKHLLNILKRPKNSHRDYFQFDIAARLGDYKTCHDLLINVEKETLEMDLQAMPFNFITNGMVKGINHEKCFEINKDLVSFAKGGDLNSAEIDNWWPNLLKILEEPITRVSPRNLDRFIIMCGGCYLYFESAIPENLNSYLKDSYIIIKTINEVHLITIGQEGGKIAKPCAIGFEKFAESVDKINPKNLGKISLSNEQINLFELQQFIANYATNSFQPVTSALKVIYARIKNNLEKSNQAMGLDENTAIFEKISQAIQLCQTGFNSLIQFIPQGFSLPNNFSELLLKFRSNVVENSVKRHALGENHTTNRFYTIASVGFGVLPSDTTDPGHGLINDNLVIEYLLRAFQENFRLYPFIDGLIKEIENILFNLADYSSARYRLLFEETTNADNYNFGPFAISLPQEIELKISSCGHMPEKHKKSLSKESTYIKIGANDVNQYKPGLNVAIINGITGKISKFAIFGTDAHDESSGVELSAERFSGFIDTNTSEGDIIAITVCCDAKAILTNTIIDKLKNLGSKEIENLVDRSPWIFVAKISKDDATEKVALIESRGEPDKRINESETISLKPKIINLAIASRENSTGEMESFVSINDHQDYEIDDENLNIGIIDGMTGRLKASVIIDCSNEKIIRSNKYNFNQSPKSPRKDPDKFVDFTNDSLLNSRNVTSKSKNLSEDDIYIIIKGRKNGHELHDNIKNKLYRMGSKKIDLTSTTDPWLFVGRRPNYITDPTCIISFMKNILPDFFSNRVISNIRKFFLVEEDLDGEGDLDYPPALILDINWNEIGNCLFEEFTTKHYLISKYYEVAKKDGIILRASDIHDVLDFFKFTPLTYPQFEFFLNSCINCNHILFPELVFTLSSQKSSFLNKLLIHFISMGNIEKCTHLLHSKHNEIDFNLASNIYLEIDEQHITIYKNFLDSLKFRYYKHELPANLINKVAEVKQQLEQPKIFCEPKVDLSYFKQITPLIAAISADSNKFEITWMLLNCARIDINAANGKKWTALHQLAFVSKNFKTKAEELLDLLAAARVDIHAKTEDNRKPSQVATSEEFYEILVELESKAINNSDNNTYANNKIAITPVRRTNENKNELLELATDPSNLAKKLILIEQELSTQVTANSAGTFHEQPNPKFLFLEHTKAYESNDFINYPVNELPLTIQLEVASSGGKNLSSEGPTFIEINNKRIPNQFTRGLNVAIIKASTGELKGFQVFDTNGWDDEEKEFALVNSQALISFIESSADSDIIAITVYDDASQNIGDDVKNKLKELGSKYIDDLKLRSPWIFACRKKGGGIFEKLGEPDTHISKSIKYYGASYQEIFDEESIDSLANGLQEGEVLESPNVPEVNLQISTPSISVDWQELGLPPLRQITVGLDGNLYGVGKEFPEWGQIWSFKGGWASLDESNVLVKQIAVAKGDAIYGIGTDDRVLSSLDGWNGHYFPEGKNLRQITLDSDCILYGVEKEYEQWGHIWSSKDNCASLVKSGVLVKQIAVAKDKIYGIGINNKIWSSENGWADKYYDIEVKQIAIDSNGHVYAIKIDDNKIWSSINNWQVPI